VTEVAIVIFTKSLILQLYKLHSAKRVRWVIFFTNFLSCKVIS